MTNEELAIRIQGGESDLLGELWQQNIGAFHNKAYQLYNSRREQCTAAGVEADDVVQCCYFALCDAVKAFNPDKEYPFLSYIKYPLKTQINALLGVRTAKRDALNESRSLDAPIDNDEGSTLLDFQVDPNSGAEYEAVIDDVFQVELHAALENTLDRLPADRAAIIRGRYFDGKTQSEIAAELGVSGSRVYFLEQDALHKLRGYTTLQAFHDEVLTHWAYKHTGLKAFRETGYSSVERAVEKADELTERRLKWQNEFKICNDV
jgi:RNA polymerase sporulation-specific sigma factor